MRVAREQVLVGLGHDEEILVTTTLSLGRIHARRAGKPPVLKCDHTFELFLDRFGEHWAAAMERAQSLTAEGATLDGVPLRGLRVSNVALSFDEGSDPRAFRFGTVEFRGTLDEPPPFCFVPGTVAPAEHGDRPFLDALEAAYRALQPYPILIDQIEERERYWVFPVRGIGCLGAFVDRRTGRALTMGSGIERDAWIWAYEHGLLEDVSGDLIVEHIADPNRAFDALRTFARVTREDLTDLPLTILGCANLRALPLREAGDALTWRVQKPTPPRS